MLLSTLLATGMGLLTFEILRGVTLYRASTALRITFVLIVIAVAILSLPRPGDEFKNFIIGEDNWVTDELFFSILSRRNVGSSSQWINGVLRACFAVSLPLYGVPFLLMLWKKWFGELASPEEKTAGAAGFQAWFRPRNIIWAAVLIVGLWVWLDVSLLGGTLIFLILLAAYPLYRFATASALEDSLYVTPVQNADALNDQRVYVLKMVESGKVTADEGADLLNALAATDAAGFASKTGQRRPLTKLQQLLLLGLSIVVISFFLPWLRIDVKNELQGPSARITQLMEAFPETKIFFQQLPPVISITGSQVKAGWIILLAILISAGSTLLSDEVGGKTLKVVQVACQTIAGLLLVYIITSSFQFLAIGFLLMLVGYGLQLLAVTRTWGMVRL